MSEEKPINPFTAAQSRTARALLDWTLQDLADASKLSEVYVRKFEKGTRNPSEDAIKAIRSALESAGVEFIADGAASDSGGPGVRLAKRQKGRSK